MRIPSPKEGDRTLSERLRSWSLTALVTILTLVIAWTIFLYATDQTVSNNDILIEMRAQSCVLSLPVEERSAATVEECRREAAASVP